MAQVEPCLFSTPAEWPSLSAPRFPHLSDGANQGTLSRWWEGEER